jgi:glycosyltransferase involved in cell wall biosynthesis
MQARNAVRLPPVLVLGDHLGYPDGVSHGVTTYFLEVLPALANAGVDLTACFLREPHPAAEKLRQNGISPLFLSARKQDPFVVRRVAALARERGCRIIHASGIKGTLAGRIAARAVGAATIVHIHDLNRPGAVVSGLQRLFSKPTDLGVCVAEAIRELAVTGYHLRPDRVRIVFNSIALERFRTVPADAAARVRTSLGIPPSAQLLGVIGRLYAVKGQLGLMRMMAPISQACPQCVLLVIGDGPEREACEALARELGLTKQILFLGQRADIPELLAALDVLVVPSQSEGLPLAAIEAMAAGRAVVGFDVGGMREVVEDGRTGVIVPRGDRGAFVQSVVALLQDGQRLARFRERASVSVERFTLARHIAALLECYREASPQ